MTKRLSPVHASRERLKRVAGWASMLFILATGTVQAKTGALIPAPPKIAASSFILMDAGSGEILASENPDQTQHPASLTKMMTAYIGEIELAAGNISRDDQVLVSEKSWKMSGSTMFLEVGDKVPVQELLKGIIIVSGNDASVALAEHVAGSEDAFAQLMNNTARKLGMINSHFVNASGWPADDHYSTARDLAILSRHIVQDYPEYYDLYAQKYYQYGVDKKSGKPLRRQPNRNRLLWTNPYVDGLKTGHIAATGYGLAATAKRDGRRLVTVILGAKSEKQRAEEAQKLLTYGFRFFENVDVKKGGVTLETVPVWKGKQDKVSVAIDKDLIVTVPRGTSKDLKATLDINPMINAPIEAGQQLGTLKVTINDEVIKEVPLRAQSAVERGGFFKRLWDSVRLFFKGLF
ncbi:D-alanyl-D-alanine carboxypeptidase family protein [Endozoicomonas numazuensis]|uniref:serine-type D-Ala-D-Ala carboxypeptidase n=1 Tax=Endozoicomonas numazuensis TaxID=1137799 RepID=A0A081NLG0_9GAMM|nr:D-alanyl-D-alanine carboxypeptidase family protein [Endozoicomonas numazuensis]KEQ19283.1 D-alanyl-D-alanine carboxypeptidase [Endozoicomonas numazuensis]